MGEHLVIFLRNIALYFDGNFMLDKSIAIVHLILIFGIRDNNLSCIHQLHFEQTIWCEGCETAFHWNDLWNVSELFNKSLSAFAHLFGDDARWSMNDAKELFTGLAKVCEWISWLG